MKVILRADVDNLGHLGDIVTVRPGYGRNYLLPQGLASLATPGNLKVFEHERSKLQARNDAIRAEAAGLAGQIEAAKVVIEVRVGDGDKMYGSVTSSQIAAILAEQDVIVDRRKIQLDDGLRALGDYELDVKLHPQVTAKLSVRIVKHGHVDEPVPEEAASEEAAAESVDELSENIE
jgi:large subunit ribosomal protein L9